jgi:hypothetical protein
MSRKVRFLLVCPPVPLLRESAPGETTCLDARHGFRVRYDEWRYTQNRSPALAKAGRKDNFDKF